MAMQVQSLLVNPANVCFNGSKLTRTTYPLGFNPLMGKRVAFGVTCTKKPEDRRENDPMIDTSNSPRMNPTNSMPSTPRPTSTINPDILPASTPKPHPINTSFDSLFKFSGLLPERVNGRAAMVGFVTAMAVELYKGTDLFTQISDGGAHWFLTTSIIISVASLVPLFDGRAPQTKTDGVFNSYAELWNGRFAMLGLVALAVTEYVKGGALI